MLEDFFYFRFLATKFTGRTGLKTVLNRSVFRDVKHGFVDIKKAIHLVSRAASVWINLVPRALFLPLLHLKGKAVWTRVRKSKRRTITILHHVLVA